MNKLLLDDNSKLRRDAKIATEFGGKATRPQTFL